MAMEAVNTSTIDGPIVAAPEPVQEEPPSAPQLKARLPWKTLRSVTIGLALLITMAEISRLSGSMLDRVGQAWSFNELMGFGSLSSRAGWQADFSGAVRDRMIFLIAYVVADFAFIFVYACAINAFLKRRFEGRALTSTRVTLLILVVADVAEDILALVTLALHGHPTALGVLSWTMAGVNSLKSLACLAIAIILVGGALTKARHTVRSSLALLGLLIRQHRFTVVPLALVVLLSIVPGPNILDQVPDIVRRWTDGPGNFALEGGLAFLSLALFSATLFLIGRMRTAAAARFWDKCEVVPVRNAPLAPWFIVPLVIFAIGVLARVLGAPVGLGRLGLVCVIPIIIGICSSRLRQINNERMIWDEKPLTSTKSPIWWSAARIGMVMRTGDAIAIGLIAAAALGALRATLPVVLLAATRSITLNGFALAVLAVSCAGIFFVWPVASWALVRLAETARAAKTNGPRARLRRLVPVPGQQKPFLLNGLPIVCVGVSVTLYVLIGCFPETAGRLGVLFCLNLGVMALTGIVAGLALVGQRWAPVEFFQLLRLRSTPMLSLLIVLVVIAGFVPAAMPIHQVRSTPTDRPSVPNDYRDDLPMTIDNWALDRSADSSAGISCRRTVTVNGRTAELMPMLLVASEGGGIRAAEWTVQAMQRIASERCAQHAVVLSSGVSGGAVGLTLLRFNNHPDRVATAISNSRALSYGLIGLLVRDFTFAGTGIAMPAFDHGTGLTWVDRGALMEDAWNSAAPKNVPTTWQGLPFVKPTPGMDQARQPITGSLILNSMSVGNACRVWVSEIKLIPEAPGSRSSSDGRLDCDHAGTPGLRSVDLISRYGAFGSAEHPAAGENRCLYGLTASTAAMLAARFPYVTPSGHVGECARDGGGLAPIDQLVDGGYLENTGLGTINDLSDTWLPSVRSWNTNELQKPRPKLIVPLVAYLDNAAGTDKNAPKRDIANEFLLPPLAKLHAGSDATADEGSLQRASDLVASDQVCPAGDDFCASAVDTIKTRIYDIYPASRPQISAPLGWVLSSVSRDAIAAALKQQEGTSCTTTDNSAVCSRGYGSLYDLKEALKPVP
jgi:hypothetical protein